MANCQISAISDQCGPSQPSQDLTAIPQGRVGQVCKEWLIREDGSLAYRLQNEEISQHYKDNRFKNRIVREDIPLAKHLQENELHDAHRVPSNYARYLNDQITDNDEKIARQIQRRIWHEEQEKKTTEEADERLAQKLLQKEKARQLRKRVQKERQQVERLSQQIGADYRLISGDQYPSAQQSPTPPSPPSFQRILTEDDQELDLSEFCMPPPPGLTPEELKYFLEEQDAEIAQLLQQQELKRNKNPEKEKLAVIESQDYELAKMLQKMEKERLKRIREKLRAKQQQRENEESGSTFDTGHFDHVNYQRTSTPISPQTSFEENQLRSEENEYDIPENHLLNDNGGTSDHDLTYEEPYQMLSQQSEIRSQQPFHNIAMDLDPTYQRRLQFVPSAGHSQSNLLESCVDDDDTSSFTRPNALAQSSDSFEKLQRSTSRPSDGVHAAPVTSTASSRSSHSSSSSRHSVDNRSQKSNLSLSNGRNQLFNDIEPDEYAPPLPPRDMSLLSRNKTENSVRLRQGPTQSNFLPPHHPQHPNRRQLDSPVPSIQSSNRTSVYSTSSSSVLIPGHKRVSSMEKPKKDKHKSQEGCKTQ